MRSKKWWTLRHVLASRHCAVVGCDEFPDATWNTCEAHQRQIEADVEADYAALADVEIGRSTT